MKNERIVFKLFQSIQIYKVFFSFLPQKSSFVMHILNFLSTKTSANWFSFMIDSEDLFFIYRGSPSTNMKESQWNFCFEVKLCVQMNQSVQEISFLTQK